MLSTHLPNDSKFSTNLNLSIYIYVLCLQETRFAQSSAPRYLSPPFPTFYMASATEKHREVLIAFRCNLPFTCALEIDDPTGRYLLLQGTIGDQEVTLVTYYTPNRF